jgi:hypothetical protein
MSAARPASGSLTARRSFAVARILACGPETELSREPTVRRGIGRRYAIVEDTCIGRAFYDDAVRLSHGGTP